MLFASNEGDGALAEFLVMNGADINLAFPERTITPLTYSFSHGNHAFASKLVELGADVNWQQDNGQSLIHYVAMQGDEPSIEFLAEREASVAAPVDTCGYTAMASARAFEALALAAEQRKDIDGARQYYGKSDRQYESAVFHFEAMADSFKTRKREVQVGNFIKSIGKVAIVALGQYAAELEAKQQARSMAQISALRQASSSGTGVNGYYAALDANRSRYRKIAEMNSRIKYQSMYMNPYEERERYEARAKTTDKLGQIAEDYQTLADMCKERRREFKSKL